ncbi:hypothetical protein GOP47_0025256 [Adiantum capillus-veneris]|uniref:Uncharacterized protein n=1 Tax=Adiantum capillus-veneris TaxID=13818 RepID=A0A9D4U0H4_ADICA|nr:hypothetical protein GOP47_0025256 [Adiantum capillus-veneris]
MVGAAATTTNTHTHRLSQLSHSRPESSRPPSISCMAPGSSYWKRRPLSPAWLLIDGDVPISRPSLGSPTEMEEPASSVPASPVSNRTSYHEEPSMLINPFAHLPATQETSSSTTCSCVTFRY